MQMIARKTKVFLGIACICCSLALAVVLLKPSARQKYYQNLLYQPPRKLVVQTEALFPAPGFAIDLGCGVGNEVLFLLKKGWKVWAIDSHELAISMLTNRKDITNYKQNLITYQASFDEIDWSILPKADLIFAAYSLLFNDRKKFYQVWQHLVKQLAPNGRFAGYFFGPKFRGFDDHEQMTFLNKDEVLVLFKDFEIEYFLESENEELSGTGKEIYAHEFAVIARKKQ
jgi:tellurite methyltransferase